MRWKPEQRSDGMWYVGDQPFVTERSAIEYQKVVNDGRVKMFAAAAPMVLTALALVGGWWWLSKPSDVQRVGREFLSMSQCLEFIADDMGEPLKPISDKPGDVSGSGTISGRFFRCELQVTGTRGPVLQGRWDRPK